MILKKPNSKKRGAALVEYGLIVAGVALVAAAAVSIFGKKTSDMIGAAAAVLPGANAYDNGPIASGRLIETAENEDGAISIDAATIGGANADAERLGDNLGFDLTDLVQDTSPPPGE